MKIDDSVYYLFSAILVIDFHEKDDERLILGHDRKDGVRVTPAIERSKRAKLRNKQDGVHGYNNVRLHVGVCEAHYEKPRWKTVANVDECTKHPECLRLGRQHLPEFSSSLRRRRRARRTLDAFYVFSVVCGHRMVPVGIALIAGEARYPK